MDREGMGLTQEQLAQLVRVSRGQVARWETDVNLPSDYLVGRLAKVLRCRPEIFR